MQNIEAKNSKLKTKNHNSKLKTFDFYAMVLCFTLLIFTCILCFMGCGYTTSVLRNEKMQKIHVATFLNRTYEQGLDRLVTDAMIDEFIFKGGVKVVEEDRAEIKLSGKVTEYVLEPLSYNRENQAEEYRLRITVDIFLNDSVTKNLIWEAKGLSGEWTFLLSGPLAVSEEEAKEKAIEYLAREAVQRTLEMW